MPWRAVEAMHWELGAEGIAQRTGNPVFTTIPSSEPTQLPPIFSQSGPGPPYYSGYPQDYLPRPQLISSGPPPVSYPAPWPGPSYRVQSVSGSQAYQAQQQSYLVAPPPPPPPPPPPNSALNVPRQRRSSNISSARGRKLSGSRRPDPPTNLQRSFTQPYDLTNQLPSLRPQPPSLPRHETAPPEPLPPLATANTSSQGYFRPHPYPSPPNDNPLRLPTIKEPPQEDITPISESTPPLSPKAGTPSRGAPPESGTNIDKGKENRPFVQ